MTQPVSASLASGTMSLRTTELLPSAPMSKSPVAEVPSAKYARTWPPSTCSKRSKSCPNGQIPSKRPAEAQARTGKFGIRHDELADEGIVSISTKEQISRGRSAVGKVCADLASIHLLKGFEVLSKWTMPSKPASRISRKVSLFTSVRRRKDESVTAGGSGQENASFNCGSKTAKRPVMGLPDVATNRLKRFSGRQSCRARLPSVLI